MKPMPAERFRQFSSVAGATATRAVTPRIDLTHGGVRPLDPPFTIAVEIGDDAGRVRVPCVLGPRGGRCR